MSSENIQSNRFTAGILSVPENLKEEFVTFDTYVELVAYRDKLLASCNRIDRKLPNYHDPFSTITFPNPPSVSAQGFHAWALFVEAEDGNDLLCYDDRMVPFENRQGIRNWLAEYFPESWDDLAMVQKLYCDHIAGSRTLYNTRHQPHPWLDNLLRPTRGKIFYSDQVKAIVSRACAMNNEPDWSHLNLRDRFKYLPRFRELIFEEGRSLLDVIEDRLAYSGVLSNTVLNDGRDELYEGTYMASILWQWRKTNLTY